MSSYLCFPLHQTVTVMCKDSWSQTNCMYLNWQEKAWTTKYEERGLNIRNSHTYASMYVSCSTASNIVTTWRFATVTGAGQHRSHESTSGRLPDVDRQKHSMMILITWYGFKNVTNRSTPRLVNAQKHAWLTALDTTVSPTLSSPTGAGLLHLHAENQKIISSICGSHRVACSYVYTCR